MNLLEKRIESIKQALRDQDYAQAASFLITTLASDDLFEYWSKCSGGSDKVPKILTYIHRIRFDEGIETAQIDLIKGDLKIGVKFFLDWIQGPEDFLFLLIHERNHLILRTLYPQVNPETYPEALFNFAEDAYINGISRRTIPSTLPERYYKNERELILTGYHNRIDWNRYCLKGNKSTNPIGLHHAGLYWHNRALLKAIREVIYNPGMVGYEQWMGLMAKWYEETRFTETLKGFGEKGGKGFKRPQPEDEPDDQGETGQERSANNPSLEEEASQRPEAEGQVSDGEETREGTESDQADGETNSQGQDSPDKNPASHSKRKQSEDDDQDEDEDEDEDEETSGDPFDEEEANPLPVNRPGRVFDPVLPDYVPLVVNPDRIRPSSSLGGNPEGDEVKRIPIPFLRPDDPVVNLIRETSEIDDFTRKVEALTPEKLGQVEGLIRDTLSDRATDQVWKGYSVPVPFSISRKNAFELALNHTPVIWEKDYGVEASLIDIYVDVSGSMEAYYGYIPLIYDALRFLRGKVFEFSTEVFEADFETGYFQTTGGTNFDVVARHILERGSKAVILISDGGGYLTPKNLEALKAQIEALVYLKVEDNDERSWEDLATKLIVLGKEG